MTTMKHSGFSLVEVLIALAVIAIAFVALGFVQLTNLQATTSTRLATDVKTAANRVLEHKTASVLALSGGVFAFNQYYWRCPSIQLPPDDAYPEGGGPGFPVEGVPEPTATGFCSGTIDADGNIFDEDVSVSYDIRGVPGISGEGVVSISVTAIHETRPSIRLTIGDRITCFDVYPSPTSKAPAPCPDPTTFAWRTAEPNPPEESP